MVGLFAIALLCGCSNDSYEGRDWAGVKLSIQGAIGTSDGTRVTNAGNVSTWDVNDAIGVYTNGNGTDFSNVMYLAKDVVGNFSTLSDIYLLTESEVSLAAYFPYKEDGDLTGGVYSFSIIDEDNAYVSNDFLFASTTTTRGTSTDKVDVKFLFAHKMNRLLLTLNVTDSELNVKDGDAVAYKLNGVVTNGTFKTTDGTVTLGKTTGSMNLSGKYGKTVSIIYAPQTTTNLPLTINVGGRYYTAVLPTLATTEAPSGVSLEYEVNIKGDGVTISLINTGIDNWKPETGGSIDAGEQEPETTCDAKGDTWDEGGAIEVTEQ